MVNAELTHYAYAMMVHLIHAEWQRVDSVTVSMATIAHGASSQGLVHLVLFHIFIWHQDIKQNVICNINQKKTKTKPVSIDVNLVS